MKSTGEKSNLSWGDDLEGIFSVYGQPNCPGCKVAVELLETTGCKFVYWDIAQNKLALQFLKESNLRSVPAVFLGATKIGGLAELKKFLKENHGN